MHSINDTYQLELFMLSANCLLLDFATQFECVRVDASPPPQLREQTEGQTDP